MENEIKRDILEGKWNLEPWAFELSGLMGDITPEEAMIIKIERTEQELQECNTPIEKVYKLLRILSK